MTANIVPRIPTSEGRFQCIRCQHLLNGPLQFPCGHRMCTSCAFELKRERAQYFYCNKCEKDVSFLNYFCDKAASKEIDLLEVACPKCNWTGEYRDLENHLQKECLHILIPCPNGGCDEEFTRSELDGHLPDCRYRKQVCTGCQQSFPWNQQKEHEAECTHIVVECPNKCGEYFPRQQLKQHLNPTSQYYCTLSKKFNCQYSILGCDVGALNTEQLAQHEDARQQYHMRLLLDAMSHDHFKNGKTNGLRNSTALGVAEFDEIKQQIMEDRNEKSKTQLIQINKGQDKQKDMGFQLAGMEELVTALQVNIQEINRSYEEMFLTLQTLQATSYDGTYIWKIPDIAKRRRDAVLGKTVSLYSAPFYTNRFGYRLCLRVYLDGDGSGKGRYISYFLTIMKGEYDALLEWPFQPMVTMTLINQTGKNHIMQSFKPDPNSSSFKRPQSDMNVASGCPKFAEMSILDNPDFNVDDTMFFKCVVNVK